MADLTITAASVKRSDTSAKLQIVTWGETVLEGMPVYQKAADLLYYKSQCDGTSPEALTAGISVTNGTANQQGLICTGGPLVIGATLTIGQIYAVSAAVGKICPFADIVATNKVTLLGIASSATVLQVAINPTDYTHG